MLLNYSKIIRMAFQLPNFVIKHERESYLNDQGELNIEPQDPATRDLGYLPTDPREDSHKTCTDNSFDAEGNDLIKAE
jgi:hypothetical protein